MSLLNDKLYWKKGFKISLPSFVISCLFIKKHGQELKNERKEQGKFLRWFLLNNLHNHYTGGSTNNKVNSDIISIVKNTMPSTTIQDLILNMKF